MKIRIDDLTNAPLQFYADNYNVETAIREIIEKYREELIPVIADLEPEFGLCFTVDNNKTQYWVAYCDEQGQVEEIMFCG